MSWIESLKGAVQGVFGIKATEVLKARLEFTRDQLEAEREAHAQTKQDLSEARQRIATYEREAKPDFLSFRGVLVLRLKTGKLDRALYCPLCHSSVTPIAGSRWIPGTTGGLQRVPVPGRYQCPSVGCGWASPFPTNEGPSIIEAAAREYGIELV